MRALRRGLTRGAETDAQIAKEYHVYYKRVPTDDGRYVMGHWALIYLMSGDGKFVSAVDHQEGDKSALAKLRRLLKTAARSEEMPTSRPRPATDSDPIRLSSTGR
jgi:SCO1/SenC